MIRKPCVDECVWVCMCFFFYAYARRKNVNKGVTKLTVNKLFHVYFQVYDTNSQYITII